MYKLKSVFYGIFRHKRRNVISCLFLISTMSVAFCGFFYGDFAKSETEAIKNRYQPRCRISFRNELQYDPDFPGRSAYDVIWNGTSTTNGVPDIFFEPDVMQDYNHPYPATPEMFGRLAQSDLCESAEIAYAESAYGFAEELPESVDKAISAFYSSVSLDESPAKILTEHTVVGGSLEAFCSIAKECSSFGKYCFILKEGKLPEKGECAITDFYALVYNKSIGDSITLTDIERNPVAELKISGIYSLYLSNLTENVNPTVPGSGRKVTGMNIVEDFRGIPDVGTPFDRLGENMDDYEYFREHYKQEYLRLNGAMLGVIHTDFETAYNLYGTSETRHINNFFAYYDLKFSENMAEFEAEMKSTFPAEYSGEFTVYSFKNSLEYYTMSPQFLMGDADLLLCYSGVLTVILFFIVSVVLVRENGREVGIYLSVGVSEGDVIIKTAAENTVVIALSTIVAAVCGRYFNKFFMSGYVYLETANPAYHISGDGVIFAITAVALNFIMTALFTYIYIHAHTPIRLMRQE